MLPLWRRVCVRLQQFANKHPEDWVSYNEAFKTLMLLHYEEVYNGLRE